MKRSSVAFRAIWLLPWAALAGQPGEECAACHAKETATYLKSRMGNSIAPPAPIFGAAVARPARHLEISIGQRDGKMVHKMVENGLTAEYPVAYQIGAGKVGHTYLVRIGDYLYESPASWYRTTGWDLSPGYEQMPAVDFDRLVDTGCMFCHADNAKFLGSDARKFSGEKLEPIGCGRCHGPTAAHLANPSAKNIVNPAKLAGRARNSVCEQCHLEGVTRLLNPGKQWSDFHAGSELERTAATYILSENKQEISAVAQVDQLALSKCVKASGGKLWCATCHDPHAETVEPSKDARSKQVREICQGCHPAYANAISKATHQSLTDCVSCHMPRLTPDDIPHTASTDHRIVRRPAPLPEGNAARAELTLWQDPPAEYRARDLAVGALTIGGLKNLPQLRAEGVKMLEALPDREKENDPAVLSSLVTVHLKDRDTEGAKQWALKAVKLQPDSAFASLNLAFAFEDGHEDDAAEQQLLATIDLDPSLTQAWTNLTFLYEKQKRDADRMALLDRYLKWNPQNIWFRQLKAILERP
jgi:predicted CXXCH cytochrome family protein